MKVREIVTLNYWEDGSGWSHSECYKDEVIELDKLPEAMDWDWFEDVEQAEGEDCRIDVKLYPEDGEGEPLKTYSIRVSDLAAQRNTLEGPQHSAAALFDGGWRAADAEELQQEYHLTDKEAAALVEELERMEQDQEPRTMSPTDWIDAIGAHVASHPGKEVVIKRDGPQSYIVPPGAPITCNDDETGRAKGWGYQMENCEYWEYDTLAALLKENLDDDWLEIVE